MNPDDLDRTLKVEIDDGRAKDLDDARRIMASYRLGIRLGRGFEASSAATAAALTAINAAARAFHGGVFVEADQDAVLRHGWGLRRSIGSVLHSLGATQTDRLPDDLAYAISIKGEDGAESNAGAALLHATWEGWAGGVVLDPSDRRPEDDDQPLAGTLAGALAVSEAFQAVRGFVMAGRREVGISLWRPDLPWRHTEARGPVLEVLPASVWLLGLGHLGQAYAWSLGCLPYPANAPLVGLLDPQWVVAANAATGLLTDRVQAGMRKARVVAAALEARDMRTIIVERLFESSFRLQRNEPSIAFAGFDTPEPRRLLEEAGFRRVVDAGLGGGPQHYLDMMIHAFPSEVRATDAFPTSGQTNHDALLDQPAYVAELDRLEAAGKAEGDARCGALEVAGRTVGAAFVGAVTSTLVVAEELRALVEGPRFEVVSLSLRSPEHVFAVANPSPGPFVNLGFVLAS
jgi:hypothetical protein